MKAYDETWAERGLNDRAVDHDSLQKQGKEALQNHTDTFNENTRMRWATNCE